MNDACDVQSTAEDDLLLNLYFLKDNMRACAQHAHFGHVLHA